MLRKQGMAIHTGTKVTGGRRDGSRVFVDVEQGASRLTLDGDKVVGEEPLLVDQKLRVRDVREGPDGAVYVITDEGKLMKITPKA